jgi:AraC-like DNA-binding protein
MKYRRTRLAEAFRIEKIVTVHYFEFTRDYIFEGERHDFWELVYVDKGEVEVLSGSRGHRLQHGEAVFFTPNDFHNLWANGMVAPNLVVISFVCASPGMLSFADKVLRIGDAEKGLISQVVKEAREAFSSPLDVPALPSLERRERQPVGCEQLIKISLEMLLIMLARTDGKVHKGRSITKSTKERSDKDTELIIARFLNDNVSRTVTLNEVCRHCGISKSRLKEIYKDRTGMGVITHLKRLKMEEAKKLMRETDFTFTRISERLGYSSIHSFSRHFKKATGMTPSEYSTSVQANGFQP